MLRAYHSRRHNSSQRRHAFQTSRNRIDFRKLLHEQLENRALLTGGAWIAVFNSMTPADDFEEQAILGQNLLTESGVSEEDARIVAALDLSGSFVVQSALDSTLASVTDALDEVPGFVFVDDYTVQDETLVGRKLTPARERSENLYGPFDYDTFLLREKNGEFPDQGGVVDGPELDSLANNNAGATGTGNFTQSETTILAFGNTVVVGYNDSGSNASGSNKFTGFSRSLDGGNTFTDGGTLPTNAGGDAGDPVMARHDATGRIYFSTLGFTTSTIQMFRSDDNGATWSAPVNATPGGTSEDKQWHAVDNFAGPGNGNVYLISRRFGGAQGIYLFRSTDGGATFGPVGGTLIAAAGGNNVQGAFVAVGPDHSVNAFYFDENSLPERIMMRRSTDLGLTFGAPITVATLGTSAGFNGDLGLTGLRQGTGAFAGFRSNAFPHATVNPVSGHLYVTYGDNPAGADKADVFMRSSTDNGATWSPAVRVNDDVTSTDQWQPTLAVTPDGSKLGIFYYSRQEDAVSNNLFKYYGRVASISGGTLTFAPSFAVSDVASLPEFGRDSLINPTYMSDYDTAVATPGAFHVIWSDNRDDLVGGGGRKDPNVYYERISLGLAVTTTIPAVNSVVTTAPTVFTVNVSDTLDPLTVDAGDLTVNGIAADSVAYTPGTTTMTFTYLVSPVTVQGSQTMSIAAGAFERASDGDPVAAFSGSFIYDTVALAVVATIPPFPNGIFTLPAPFTYDVTFNEPVNPASVQTTDLALAGIPGAVVSGVTVLAGDITARFTISGITVEGVLTASIGAGQVTDAFGGPNNAFSAAYQVDYGTVPYPTPLVSKNPLGSLIYDPTISGIINFAGDTDNFTLNIDPGQTISVLLDPAGSQDPTMYGGVGNGAGSAAGQLLLINQTNAASALVGDPVTPGGITGLAFDPSLGIFFGSTIQGFASTSNLVRIHPDTGALLGTVGPITDGLGGPAMSIGDMAIQPGTNTLYAIRSNPDQAFLGGFLYTVDKLTGVATFVGNTGGGAGGGISFAPDGSLYQTGYNSNFDFFSLNQLNPANAARISTVALETYFDGLAIRPNDGVFFAALGGSDSSIYTINPTTGAITFVGGSSASTSDLAFRPSTAVAPIIELRDPSNTLIGTAMAGAGISAILQTVPTTTGGIYTISAIGGGLNTGAYTLQVTLNAALEVEGKVREVTNDSPGTAQNIDGSFIGIGPAGGTAERGAVLGTTDVASGYSATVVPFAFTDISATGTTILQNVDDSTATVNLPFSFVFYGSSFTQLFPSSNGLITFGSANPSFSNDTLSANPTQAAIAPFWDDLYLFNPTDTATLKSQVIGPVGSRQLILQWDQVNFFPNDFSSDTLTFQAILSEGTNTIQFNYLDLTTLGEFGSEGADATAGIKQVNPTNGLFTELINNNGPNAFVGSGQSTLLSPVLATPDFYSLALGAGQTTTLAVTSLAGGTTNLDLIAPDGTTVLASGVAGSTNLTRVISNFAVPAAGTYYARITGGSLVPYSVVSTINAALDTEPNEPSGGAQSISGLEGALGAIAATNVYEALVVAPVFEDISGTGTVISAISGADDAAATITPGFTFPFYGSSFSSFGVSSNGLITFGGTDPSFTNGNLTTTPALATIAALWDDLHMAGGAALSNAFFQVLGAGLNQHLTIQWNQIRFFSGGTLGDTLTFQAQLFVDGRIQFNYLDLVSGAAVGNNGGSATVGLKAAGTQGPNRLLLAQNVPGGNAFVGTGKSTLIRLPAGEDWYSFAVASLDSAFAVQTSTPADGPGEFVNVLNPRIELYDPANVLVATGTVLPDGRNESIEHTPLMTGTYRVRLLSEGGTTGEYFLGKNFAPANTQLVLDECIDDVGTVAAAGSFTDPDVLNSHVVTIDWGDGNSTVIPLSPGQFSFSASHPYVPGNNTFAAHYVVSATVTDNLGHSDADSADLAVAAGQGAYRLQLSLGGVNTELYRGNTLLISQPAGVIDLAIFVGAANRNDSLNVSGVNGNPIPVFGVGFAGRIGSQDTLTISAAAYNLMDYEYDNGDDGHVTLVDGKVREICFDDLEQITTTATTVVAQFHLPEDDNDAVLQRSGSSLTLTPALPPWAREPFVPTRFVNPSGAFIVNGRGGDDIVEIHGASSITLAPHTVMNVETTEIVLIHTAVLTVGTMFVTGDLEINDAGRINGVAVEVHGNVDSDDPELQGTAKIRLAGSANQTLSGPGQLPHLDISKSGGSVTVLSDIGVRGNLTGSGGTFAPSASYLVLQQWNSAINFSGPVSLYNLEIYKIYTEEVTLLSDLNVAGHLQISSGGLNLGTKRAVVGGNLDLAAYAWLAFTIDVANPPAQPRLEVGGTLTFAANSKLRISTAGSSGPPVGGNHELVRAGDIQGFSGATLDFPANVDAIFENLDSLYLDLAGP